MTANTRMATRPTKKYGKADTITKTGGKMLSNLPPHAQAPIIPMNVPNANAITVATPTRPSVHGSAPSTTWPTGFGKKVSDVPKRPVTEFAK